MLDSAHSIVRSCDGFCEFLFANAIGRRQQPATKWDENYSIDTQWLHYLFRAPNSSLALCVFRFELRLCIFPIFTHEYFNIFRAFVSNSVHQINLLNKLTWRSFEKKVKTIYTESILYCIVCCMIVCLVYFDAVLANRTFSVSFVRSSMFDAIAVVLLLKFIFVCVFVSKLISTLYHPYNCDSIDYIPIAMK